MKKLKKRKGFTLIELIAVIAILAILGAILVPKILGYRAKAEKSNYQASAKTIVHAIQAYNADKDSNKISNTTDVTSAINTVNSENSTPVIKNSGDTYNKLTASGITVGKLVTIAQGDFNLDSSGNINNVANITAGDIDD